MVDGEQKAAESLFRAPKRRKVLRRREEEEDADEQRPASQGGPSVDVDEDETLGDADPSSSVSDALRQRKQQRARRGGMAFSSAQGAAAMGAPRETANSLELTRGESNTGSALHSIANRFAPQAGISRITSDKHMNAFVDSEFARLQGLKGAPSQDQAELQPERLAALRALPEDSPHRNPATSGQLDEIDLGPGSASHNAAMKKAAMGRTQSGSQEGPPKPRMGRNGKPLRRRPGERNSDDLKRDKLVEAIMSESKLDIYDEPEPEAFKNEHDGAADERLAAEFQREFLESLQTRAAPKKPPRPPGATKDTAKGPKLGGSRSARAAMHAQERAEALKKKK